MASVAIKARFPCPAEELFAILSDARRDPEWAPAVASATQVVGDGPGLGAAYDIAQRVRGRIVTLRLEVVAFDAPRSISWTMAAKGMTYQSTIRITPHQSGRGCVMRQRNTVRLRPRIAELGWWILAQRVLRAQVAGLRTLLAASQ